MLINQYFFFPSKQTAFRQLLGKRIYQRIYNREHYIPPRSPGNDNQASRKIVSFEIFHNYML